MTGLPVCPACSSPEGRAFFHMDSVPVHNNVLLPSPEEARRYPRGEVLLAYCQGCGFIYNAAFNPALTSYAARYENTLTFSPLFRRYLESLARGLVERYGLRHKSVLEVGCGRGDFLRLLCELGPNRGLGLDPSLEAGQALMETPVEVTFIRDEFSDSYARFQADLVCCRHVLEHLPQPGELIASLGRCMARDREAILYLEVPNASFILKDLAVWDIIYEHCGYFTAGSLTRVATRHGFEVLRVDDAFGGQYLCLEARLQARGAGPDPLGSGASEETGREVEAFQAGVAAKLDSWRSRLCQMADKGQRCVVWGAGSKGVSFVNLLEESRYVEYMVDINPRKQGSYVPGTGHRVVAPQFLQEYRPDVVILMNPLYLNEVRRLLAELACAPELLTV